MKEGRGKTPRDVDALVRKGERQGYLTALEIFGVLSPELVEDLDDLLARLHRLQINVVDTPEEGDRAVRERRSRDEEATGDALSSYLREINGVQTLDREEEIRIAKEYRAGIDLALRSVAETRFFLDRLLRVISEVRRKTRPVWDVILRPGLGEGEDAQKAQEELMLLGTEISRLRTVEKRTLDQLARRGVSPEKAQSLSGRLEQIRASQVEKISGLRFNPKFLQEMTADLMRQHQLLETLDAQCATLAVELGVAAGATKRPHRRRDPRAEESEGSKEAERRLRNVKRKIQRLENHAGMSSDALKSMARSHHAGMLRAQRARDALILSAQRLVLSSARYYGRRLGGSGMEISDLISEGNRGLMRAVELFDPLRGNRFSTFASYWVRHQMIRAIHTQSRTVYVPPHIRQQMSKILATENEILQRSGHLPSDEELASAIEMDVPSLRHTLQSFGRVSSIDRPLDPEDSGSGTYGDTLADERATPAEALEGAERRELVRALAEQLQGRERAIVFLRMGWENDEPKTLAEIGEEFGISRQRVEQLEKRALAKLRKWARTRGLEDPVMG